MQGRALDCEIGTEERRKLSYDSLISLALLRYSSILRHLRHIKITSSRQAMWKMVHSMKANTDLRKLALMSHKFACSSYCEHHIAKVSTQSSKQLRLW